MANNHGDFIWYELMTTEPEAAQSFYSELLGWSWADSGQEGIDYRTFSSGNEQVGGMLAMTTEMTDSGARPAWLGYIQVDDVPTTTAAIKAAGGNVMMEGQEVPGVGPFAMVADCCGAPFYVINDRSGEDSKAFSKHDPVEGTCAWNELISNNPASADQFYRKLFGWTKGDSMEMGPLGTYQMYNHGDYGLGAIMKKPDEIPASLWAYYFRVADIDEAKSFCDKNGAQIVTGPMEIPGGDYVFQGVDPQGAFFSLIGAKGS